jgi:transposase-like protein
MEINGYEIDNYNQFGLKTMMLCPFCSADRKRKQINAFRHWDTGFNCNHLEKKGNYIT